FHFLITGRVPLVPTTRRRHIPRYLFLQRYRYVFKSLVVLLESLLPAFAYLTAVDQGLAVVADPVFRATIRYILAIPVRDYLQAQWLKEDLELLFSGKCSMERSLVARSLVNESPAVRMADHKTPT